MGEKIQVPDGWVSLPAPVPPQLEEALSYEEEARFVAFYWTPAGDEAMFDDGRFQGDGNWIGFQSYVEHPVVAPYLVMPCQHCLGQGVACEVCDGTGTIPANLGSSEFEAEWWLVVDRQERRAYLAPVAEAEGFLAQQWPPVPNLTPEELEVFFEAFQRRVARVNIEPPTREEIAAGIRHEQELVERLVRQLDEEINQGA